MNFFEKFYVLALSFLFFLLCNQSFAQDNKSDSLDYYFDDGVGEKVRGALKVNVAQIIYGDIPIVYEHYIGNRLGLEVSLGYLLPYHIPSLFYEKDDADYAKLEGLKGGYSYFINPKFYFTSNRNDSMYAGFRIRKRKFSQSMDRESTITDCTTNIGANYYSINSRWSFDFNIALGFSTIRTNYLINPDIPEYEYFQLITPINFNITYLIY